MSLSRISNYLNEFGNFVKKSAGVHVSLFNVFIIYIVVYFSISGLQIGYNYMRLVPQSYREADDAMLRKALLLKNFK